jgi:hypothetical protein
MTFPPGEIDHGFAMQLVCRDLYEFTYSASGRALPDRTATISSTFFTASGLPRDVATYGLESVFFMVLCRGASISCSPCLLSWLIGSLSG